jgi:Na+/proline symporter
MENMGIGVLDVLFISVFLVCNVILGFISRNKCDDINETVFGKKSKFSNLTLITSICSTMVSSIFVINTIEQINLKGLQMLIMYLVMFPGMYCIMYFVMLPKIIKTEMRFSWFDYINKNYGKIVRVVFALCSLTLDIGWIAQLFVTMNITMQAIFNGSPYFCKILSIVIGIILTIYSAFGGLRAVTITDVFQFFVFFTIIVFI